MSAARGRRLAVPDDFSLDAVVASHGWYQLRPFRFDPAARALATTIRLPRNRAVDVRLARDGRGLAVIPGRSLSAADRAFVDRTLRRMLNVDDDLRPFHALCRKHAHLRWIARRKLGRLLRSQDLFEDALKTLLTTNCTWKQTVSMVGRLVDLLGRQSSSGARAFPAPAAVVDAGARFLEREVKVGYRARAAIDLARRALRGELEAFDVADPEAARLEIKSWFGFGDYAATALLALLGARVPPVVDSWALARASEIHFRGRRCTARHIERVYAPFGAWSGLVAWFDLNREHYREWPPTWGVATP